MKYILVLITLFLVGCSHVENTSDNTSQVNTDLPVQQDNSVTPETEDQYSFSTEVDTVVIHPISHATAVVEWWDDVIFADPAEDIDSYKWLTPTIVFVSHEHGDHFQNDVLEQLWDENTIFLATQSVFDQMTETIQAKTTIMANGDTIEKNGFTISAIPAYNIREEALNFHPEWRDNGYIFEKDGYRVYFSWDSEDTSEMRALTDIDLAFVSMNLPFTMDINAAVSAVLEFQPSNVFPYHFRWKQWLADVESFKAQVEVANSDINVIIADWYGE